MRLPARAAALVVENDESLLAAVEAVDFSFQREAAFSFLKHGRYVVLKLEQFEHFGLRGGKGAQSGRARGFQHEAALRGRFTARPLASSSSRNSASSCSGWREPCPTGSPTKGSKAR